jgi:hypothetical protein
VLPTSIVISLTSILKTYLVDVLCHGSHQMHGLSTAVVHSRLTVACAQSLSTACVHSFLTVAQVALWTSIRARFSLRRVRCVCAAGAV